MNLLNPSQISDERSTATGILSFEIPKLNIAEEVIETRPSQQSSAECSSSSTSSSVFAKDREDFLEKAFRVPTKSQKPSKRLKSIRPQPPAVVTSDEFREWYKKMEQNKENEEQKRQANKAAREAKRLLLTKNLNKKRLQTKSSKPRM